MWLSQEDHNLLQKFTQKKKKKLMKIGRWIHQINKIERISLELGEMNKNSLNQNVKEQRKV